MKSDKGILKAKKPDNRLLTDKKVLLRFNAGDKDEGVRNSAVTEDATNISLLRKS